MIVTNVSRETSDRLAVYADLLRRWNPKINLVASNSIETVETRHFHDSAQTYIRLPDALSSLVDLGSGAGFPGLVLAILGAERSKPFNTVLIESDQRKAVFLRTVIRETGAQATVLTQRIERAAPLEADVVTARALAPLPELLAYVHRHKAEHGLALLLKGAHWRAELAEARKSWTFTAKAHTSETDPKAAILEIGALSHA